ncbi:NAD(P)-dependent alcohol dehydrogenase [Aquabacterium sp. J223]|uniref:NAD(P)-dependent alcohol dehydrogenase n=1 Tax=Aquabacterium sp. J223 TaxID=2898431 RepID=UPI0021ADE511|nr:NAD(P)-dependent alcohol dehydrogenase [Aquabacterium sp. J223]UUX94526.1 NAD(P)-dependent alcohol dehydrogenase [Aquabacterium sp. J223]
MTPRCTCSVTAALTTLPGAPFTLARLTLDGPRDDEVLVRIVACGICQTDLAVRDSPALMPKPAVLGHEGAGIVEAIGERVTRVRPGDAVVISFSSCGRCSACLRGEPAYCAHTRSLNFGGGRPDGSTALHEAPAAAEPRPVRSHFFGQSSFATRAVVNERNLVRVTEAVDAGVALETLGPMGCGLQTGAGGVLNSLKVRPGSRLAIYGTGAVGLAATMAGAIAGAATVLAVDVQPQRLALARELGATHVVDARDPEADAQIEAALGGADGGGADFALDTSGRLDTLRGAVQRLAPRGVLGLISSAKGADVPVNALHLMVGGRGVVGIHQGDSVPQVFIPQLIAWHRAGRFPFERLLGFYDLARINDAADDLAQGRVIKPVVRMPAA